MNWLDKLTENSVRALARRSSRRSVLAAALASVALPWSSRELVWTDLLTVAGGVAVLALLYTALDRLLGLVMPRTAALRGAR